MSVRIKQMLKFVAKLAVAAILLAWVFSKVDFENFGQTVRAARWQYLLGVWGSTALFSWIQAVALQWILRKQDVAVRLNTVFGATCVTSMYGLVVPGFVRTGVKWYVLKRATGKGASVLSAMLYNQVALTAVMMAVGLAGLIVVNPSQALAPGAGRPWILPALCGAGLVLLALLSVLALNQRTGGPVLGLLVAALRPLPQTVREKGRTVLTQLATFHSAGWRFHLTIASLNVVDALLVGLLWYLFAARAASIVVPTSVLIWLCAIVFLLNTLQITVANLGLREGVLVSLLPAYGVPHAAALLMSMILLSSLVFLAALGVVYQILWTLRSPPGEGSSRTD
jgi:uncharacterized membrane protein YbhN (UPF0104 family)